MIRLPASYYCVEGRLMRHDPQPDDPELMTDIGQCEDCSGDGCGDENEPVYKGHMRHDHRHPGRD
jgi:hypothetical protein